ncbi:hypothetical protein CYMTET_52009 [Cymbomonas tetramitiformis]|uniref:Uncharacterized protein n=1 Tax=Cymbomonas tetramitiformis TaxID=36881 RepID=A0AAE0BL25_9CHLO|nr:hypothetical protein CYMTET_52009 [Cymbomonas tetramitiformis]
MTAAITSKKRCIRQSVYGGKALFRVGGGASEVCHNLREEKAGGGASEVCHNQVAYQACVRGHCGVDAAAGFAINKAGALYGLERTFPLSVVYFILST